MNKQIISISPFHSINETLATLSYDAASPLVLILEPGVYREKVTISRPNLTMIGSNANNTIITFDDYAMGHMPDGSKRGTFRSYTMLIDANDVTLKNITIENTSGVRSKAGQAIALYADGDRLVFDNCRFTSLQDTLFTGPLPEVPYQVDGFIGPKEFAPRLPGRHYYHQCYICGDIDFIFGSATAYFSECEICSIHKEKLAPLDDGTAPIYGYITAASTPKEQAYGYVFSHCKLTSDCPKESVYLGRPWRDYAKTVFLNCSMGEHIKPEGFHDWGKEHARDLITYGEYQNIGPGAHSPSARAYYVTSLTEEESLFYAPEKVLGFDYLAHLL